MLTKNYFFQETFRLEDSLSDKRDRFVVGTARFTRSETARAFALAARPFAALSVGSLGSKTRLAVKLRGSSLSYLFLGP